MQWLPERRHQRALVIAVIVALGFGAYFLRPYFSVILLSAIMAYMFHPIYSWLLRHTKKRGAASALTFFISLFIVVIPLVLLGFLTFLQAESLLKVITGGGIDIQSFSNHALDKVNHLLTQVPGGYHITQAQVTSTLNHTLSSVAQGVLNLLRSSASSIAALFVTAVIYVYLFTNLLVYGDKLVGVIKQLNPLGGAASTTYLDKMGAMTTAMVRGQFIIATVQGLLSALIIHIAGVHHVFFFMFLLLTVLSVIPLGAGIVSIPIGLYLLVTGNIWQGILVLSFHFAVVTNIDNILRPHLVPKDARLNSALTILSVFAGISMFGFLGVVIGPVIMILITTTMHMYLQAQRAAKAEPTAMPD
ncbi:MAG TPA: AI-2E family transporter [Candidatus Saccharimonadales bacterium]|jgi:predicted PurR-regulated permease PerM|nr:AI-2E family transporter [Candidatus Saccharimonadales bacterium]